MKTKKMSNKRKQPPIKNGDPSDQRLTGTGVDAPLIYGRQEAAEALCISVTTLDRLHRERKGPKCILIKRRVLYPRKSLELWVLEQLERVD